MKKCVWNVSALSQVQIVLPEDASRVLLFAAEELMRYMKKITGVSPEIGRGAGRRIVFSTGPDAALKYDGFRVACRDGEVVISSPVDRGILNAVYSILRENRCRWVWPGEDFEAIPECDEFTFQDEVVNPDLEFRGVCIFSVCRDNIDELPSIFDWLGKNRYNLLMTSAHRTMKRPDGWRVEWDDVGAELYGELEKRGMILDMSEHSGRYFFPTSHFDEHPEYFAMNADGVRHCKGQICYSNPDAVEILADNCARYAAGHPEVAILGVWPEDGYGFCQCEKCRTTPGIVLQAVNSVARKVAEVRPYMMVEYLSYTSETSVVPEDILPEKNIVTLVANTVVAREWLRKSERAGALGVYRLHYRIADNTAERANLPFRIAETKKDCQETVALNLRGIIPFFIGTDTWYRSMFNLYFLSLFSWDAEASCETLLRDLCRSYFGSAAEVMYELFCALENIPRVDQSTPLPWPLWQNWTTLEQDYAGAKWDALQLKFADIRGVLDRAEMQAEDVSNKHFVAVEKFISFQEMMFASWHCRALAVTAFRCNDADTVRRCIREAGALEQRLIEEVTAIENKRYGACGAWTDYKFFLNWRLQLDRELHEMKTDDNKDVLCDCNPEMELFLPGLLGV